MFDLAGKTAIITGGSSGIDRAISLLFAKQGADVYILDVDESGSLEVIEEIEDGNGKQFLKSVT